MRKKWAAVGLLLVLVALLVVISEITFLKEPETIVVPDDYPTIQEAIDNAPAGGTVFVRNGTHYSPSDRTPIFITKKLSLIGEDPQNTIIDGFYDKRSPKPWGWETLQISAPDVTLSGFTITNSEHCIVVTSRGGEEPNDCRITGNNIVNGSIGINVEDGSGLVITRNNIVGCVNGIDVDATDLIITENNITEGGKGIQVNDARNVIIHGNNISHNQYGVNLEWWGPYYVYENNITDNRDCGIQFGRHCNNVTVHDNRIERNSIGIKLENFRITENTVSGLNNAVSHNNIIDNSQQAFVEKTCAIVANLEPGTYDNGTDIVFWDNGTVGNYWSDYETKYPDATEVDNSGTANTPYTVDENNTDNHPLTMPITITLTPFTIPKPPPSDTTLQTVAILAAVATLCIIIFFIHRTNQKGKTVN